MSSLITILKEVSLRSEAYVFGLKGNQANLLRDTEEYYQAVEHDTALYPEVQYCKTNDKGHGRTEAREYCLCTQLDWLAVRNEWTGLNGLGLVRSKVVTADGNETTDVRYYITSLTDVKSFANAVRSHWGIENSLHWCLDMSFNEDRNRTRKDHSAENMAVVRHLALDIRKQYPAKMSLARKRRRCMYDFNFLADVLLSLHA